ncbi:MAG: M55 family metallopeptidase [Planctomycetota bacterium]
MRIYILADMEGISGIRWMPQVKRDSGEFDQGRRLMMADINAAVDGAMLGGASEVVVCDTHAGGGQVRMEEMDERAVYEMPTADDMMPSLDESFAGVVLLGHHARAGTLNGFLDHTMNSGEWFEYRINEQVVGEIGIEAAYAGHYGVPIIAISGDQATAEEARELLGDSLPCAVVKWGLGRNKAKCLPVTRAREIVRDTIRQAVEQAHRCQPFCPELPATIELTLYRSDYADALAARPNTQRVDARRIRRTVRSLADIRGW